MVEQQQEDKPKLGRPEIKLTEQQLCDMDQMATDNCKDYTIANVLGIDAKTLKKHYSKRLIQKRAKGRADLRRGQRTLSKDNAAMAIFLGKNELEQTDRQEVVHSFDWRTLTKDGSDSTAN